MQQINLSSPSTSSRGRSQGPNGNRGLPLKPVPVQAPLVTQTPSLNKHCSKMQSKNQIAFDKLRQ